MLFPALCALREHFASALAVSLGSHGLFSRRDLFQENMSLSDSKQTTTHGRTDGLPPLQVLIGFVHPPLWPGAALQPALGRGFVQISASASCRMEDLAGWGYWGISCCHMWPAALSSASGPEQWQGPGSLFLGVERCAHDVQEAPTSQHEREPTWACPLEPEWVWPSCSPAVSLGCTTLC